MKTSSVVKTNTISVISTKKKKNKQTRQPHFYVVLSSPDFPDFWIIDLTSEVIICHMTLKPELLTSSRDDLHDIFFPRRSSSIRGQARVGRTPSPLVPSKDAKWPVPARVNPPLGGWAHCTGGSLTPAPRRSPFISCAVEMMENSLTSEKRRRHLLILIVGSNIMCSCLPSSRHNHPPTWSKRRRLTAVLIWALRWAASLFSFMAQDLSRLISAAFSVSGK